MIISATNSQQKIGSWENIGGELYSSDSDIFQAFSYIHSNLYIIETKRSYAVAKGGAAFLCDDVATKDNSLPIAGYIPSNMMENLGDRSFCDTYGLKYPLIAGAMANGICSTDIVESMGENGMLAFFGAAGLPIEKIVAAIDKITGNSKNIPFGFNLIHSPNEPDHESAVVDLYLKRKIHLVEASAYLGLTLPVVKYRVSGIHRDENGEIVTPNRVIAKVSRLEVATKFFSPPPDKMLNDLVTKGDITQEQAELAKQIPMAQDITAESDSGGHTDNRPAITIVPTLLALRDRMQAEFGYKDKLRVGAAGGIATPAAVASMFSMGAAYVVTGSINQSCIESGSSDVVREMLAGSRQADVTMAPAADMFEMGVKVQVLKLGTMFAMRAAKLYELYCKYESLDVIPLKDRTFLEKSIFCKPLETVWDETKVYFSKLDPDQISRGETNPKHKMALLFRWYLGQSSRWANSGVPSRKIDYQVWCGPSMGAFNEWVKGTFLEEYKSRKVAEISLNLLYGAAVNTRLNVLRSQGFMYPADAFRVVPLKLDQIREFTDLA